MLKACHFKPLDGFNTLLEHSICHKTMYLELANIAELKELLPEYDDWTTLAIVDGRALELVVVKNHCGLLHFMRGQEQTTAKAFPCNAYVHFMLTKVGVEALACCQDFFANCQKGL